MKLETLQQKIQEHTPKIHSITNTITSNDCANLVLAAGGSATMASDPAEAAEMTSHTDALVLNLGAVSSLDAMIPAGKEANRRNHPVVLDPVAAGATTLRREACQKLMEHLTFTAIRGNSAEIHTLAILSRQLAKEGTEAIDESAFSFVDVKAENSMQKSNRARCLSDAVELSQNTGAIVVASGIEDLIVSEKKYQVFKGGSALSSHITGSGCMLTELIAVCLTAANETNGILPWDAVCGAVQWMNQAAKTAENLTRQSGGGTMTYRMHLIDAISMPLLQANATAPLS